MFVQLRSTALYRYHLHSDWYAARTARLTFSFRSLEEELPADQATAIFRPPYRVEVMHNPNIIY
jgi:hypothetical protein